MGSDGGVGLIPRIRGGGGGPLEDGGEYRDRNGNCNCTVCVFGENLRRETGLLRLGGFPVYPFPSTGIILYVYHVAWGPFIIIISVA